ncbi:MAG: aminotransferase class V-fold PLP-dependent enzyme [Saprospiraceae bacterium]|nr:aminotransferase class V-fold PLP-dependent enzyme [Saprospiraceae bacterium]
MDTGTLVQNQESSTENQFFEKLRSKEYSRLDHPNHHVYLDFTGGNLYAESLVKKHHAFLLEGVFGNPHSINPTSETSTHQIEAARSKVIEFFNAEDYFCVFTSNASGALKIVGESYPFNQNSHFVLLADNHNSVNGIREYCKKRGGQLEYVPVQYEDLQISPDSLEQSLKNCCGGDNNLFAFPAQSNVSGVKHDLSWIKYAHDLGYDVLLDAAAFVPTSKLDLKKFQPEFVTVSFYKIFGFPTGIGCLLIKKSVFNKLQKPWFAGGTVTMVSVATPQSFLTNNHERFEDGTLNYLGVPAIKTGLEFIESIGIERINKRIRYLTGYLIHQLQNLQYNNGKPVVKIFGPKEIEVRGGNVVMNFYDAEGKNIPFETIDLIAKEKNISIRSGCFCNPGIDEINNCITNEEMTQYFVSRDKGDYEDIVHYLGKMRGATRVSMGIATTIRDLDAFVDLVKSYFHIE